jgi:MoxR-like ATPase
VEHVAATLAAEGYLADEALSTAVFLAARLGRPLLLEGEAGVGKTAVASAVAAAAGARLIRLQCHDGIDAAAALYDWDYRRQILSVQGRTDSIGDDDLYSRRFLVRRPLLEALEVEPPVVLLIDDVDRSDEEFEALLLELLADYRITIPELGAVSATTTPFVVLTSNRTRELHDALKRRCLYHWIDYPSRERELAIVQARCPGVADAIAHRICDAVERLRGADLYKPPGVGETLAWVQTLHELGSDVRLENTLGVVLKVREDIEQVRSAHILDGV